MEDVISRRAREALGDTKRRCRATNRSGDRCGRAPIPGGFVCSMHGGRAPAVQKTARERLLAGLDPAIDYVVSMVTRRPPCKHCGRRDSDRDPVVLRAALSLLDRLGFHPSVSVQVAAQAPPPYFAWLPQDRLDLMHRWIHEAKTAMERGAQAPVAGFIDAELIEPEPPAYLAEAESLAEGRVLIPPGNG